MPVFATAKALVLSFCLFGFSVATWAAERVSIPHSKVSKSRNGYALNATIHYPLSPRIIEAINHGVPITFTQEVRLIHNFPLIRQYWHWQRVLWSSLIRYQLRYHALSEQYILVAIDTSKHRVFPSLDLTLDALGKVDNLTIPSEHVSEHDLTTIQIRSGIDINALPTPLRPGALLSDKWQIKSPWVDATWP